MSAATGPVNTVLHRQGEIMPVALASAVQVYKGAAAGFVKGTGFGLPLVPTTSTHQFCGVWAETKLSVAPAGTTFTEVLRRGVWAFDQTGLTAANIGQRAYFSDDHTIVTTAGTTYAGVICSVDANGKAWVDIESAVRDVTGSNDLLDIVAGVDMTNVAGAAQVAATLILPANTLKVGDVLRLSGQIIGKTRTASDTAALTLNYGATDLLHSFATLGATFAHATTNWLSFWHDVVIRTIGATGTGYGTGIVAAGTAGATLSGINTAAFADFDTTVAQKLELGCTFSANNTTDAITVQMFMWQVLRA